MQEASCFCNAEKRAFDCHTLITGISITEKSDHFPSIKKKLPEATASMKEDHKELREGRSVGAQPGKGADPGA